MGDPAGVGPEICLRLLQRNDIEQVCHPLVFGDATVLREVASRLGLSCHTPVVRAMNWTTACGELCGVVTVAS